MKHKGRRRRPKPAPVPQRCTGCPWKCTGMPCLWPEGLCPNPGGEVRR